VHFNAGIKLSWVGFYGKLYSVFKAIKGTGLNFFRYFAVAFTAAFNNRAGDGLGAFFNYLFRTVLWSGVASFFAGFFLGFRLSFSGRLCAALA